MRIIPALFFVNVSLLALRARIGGKPSTTGAFVLCEFVEGVCILQRPPSLALGPPLLAALRRCPPSLAALG